MVLWLAQKNISSSKGKCEQEMSGLGITHHAASDHAAAAPVPPISHICRNEGSFWDVPIFFSFERGMINFHFCITLYQQSGDSLNYFR